MTAELTQEWSDLESPPAAKEKQVETTTTISEAGSAVTSTQDIEFTIEPVITISKEELLLLAKDIVAFYMTHNAEADACDLVMEIERVDLLLDTVEKETYQRVCLYLLG